MMRAYSYLGQSTWFAFGAWVGVATWIFVDILEGHPFKIRSIVVDGSSLPYFIAFYIPCALFLTLPFFVWQVFRTQRAKVTAQTPWLVPLLLGLVYFPIVGAMIPVLCMVTNQGQGWRIGTAVFVVLFGLPVVFSEICLRAGQSTTPDCQPPSSFTGDSAGKTSTISAVITLYHWIGTCGALLYLIVGCVFIFAVITRHASMSLIETLGVSAATLAYLTFFITCFRTSRELAVDPDMVRKRSRWIAIIMAILFFPILTAPGIYCVWKLNSHYE